MTRLGGELTTVTREKDTALAEVADAKTKGKTEVADQLWTAAGFSDTKFPEGVGAKPATADEMVAIFATMLNDVYIKKYPLGTARAEIFIVDMLNPTGFNKLKANAIRSALKMPQIP